jgi:N-acetylglucosamine-6-phosphate deacetylase
MNKNIIFINGLLLTPHTVLNDKVLYIREGKIERISDREEYLQHPETSGHYSVIDVKGMYISPGFIDIHTHGANGIDAAFGPYDQMAAYLARHGTTAFLPTFWNMDLDSLISGCRLICSWMRRQKADHGAQVIGINSEGPFINPDRGAQSEEHAIIPTAENVDRILSAAEGNLKIMTVSSEIAGYENLVRTLRKYDVHAALGYCHASPPRLRQALNLGISHIDHIFNCFADPVPCESGVKAWGYEEELLVCDELYAEVIADKNGIHVPPVLLTILLRCKGAEKIILISDSRDAAGSPPGRYTMKDGLKIVLKEGDDVVRLENGSLAGSLMSMNDAIRNFMRHTGISLPAAVTAATYNPAKFLALEHRKGSIQAGADADLAVFDEDINVHMTLVGGKIVYQRKSFTAR